jgi:hypothetical protein
MAAVVYSDRMGGKTARRALLLGCFVLCFLNFINSVSLWRRSLWKQENITASEDDRLVSSRLDLVLISDRGPNATTPLQGFVNSLLYYTTAPINLNIVTGQPSLPWLDLLNRSEYFSVFYHDSKMLAKRAADLLNRTKYKSGHYSAKIATQKLFLSSLNYPTGTASKVLMMDDDIILYEDIVPMFQHIRQHPERLSLVCGIDPKRVKMYFTSKNKRNNGHSTRYCNAGIIGFPLGESIVQAFEQTLFDLTEEYPASKSKMRAWAAADQDVINRYLGKQYNDECDVDRENCTSPIDLIPCDWGCDWNSCGHAKSNSMPPRCSTCQNIDRCRAFHFLTRTYNEKALDSWSEKLSWKYYNQLDSLQVLDKFVQRLSGRNESAALSSA